MRFSKKKDKTGGIPTASMADIAFLLILFFMVTTVFRVVTGLQVALPKSEMGHKLRSRDIIHIYVNTRERISINDRIFMDVNRVSSIMSGEIQKDPSIIVSLRIDEETKYNIVGDIFDQLSVAKALRVSLATEKMRG
ncbi:biopolymer transporter ExbD [candidate division WOR-3 bacterium]|nr:biopolymer transporter ExbD [candidate division WOR-3 bacterium]